MRISDWSSDVCSSDLPNILAIGRRDDTARPHHRTSDRTMCYGALERQSIPRRGGASAGIGGVAGATSDGRIPAPSPPPAAAMITLIVLDAARDCLRRPRDPSHGICPPPNPPHRTTLPPGKSGNVQE